MRCMWPKASTWKAPLRDPYIAIENGNWNSEFSQLQNWNMLVYQRVNHNPFLGDFFFDGYPGLVENVVKHVTRNDTNLSGHLWARLVIDKSNTNWIYGTYPLLRQTHAMCWFYLYIIYDFIYTHMHKKITYAYMYIYTHTYAYIKNICIYIYIYTCTHTHINIDMHTYVYKSMISHITSIKARLHFHRTSTTGILSYPRTETAWGLRRHPLDMGMGWNWVLKID